MRTTTELNQIALRWAYEQIEYWQEEYCSWDVIAEDNELTNEELEYLMNSVRFAVVVR